MRYTIEHLKAAALAARQFTPDGYEKTCTNDVGRPCPWLATGVRDEWSFQLFCEMVWNAAGRPEPRYDHFPLDGYAVVDWGTRIVVNQNGSETYLPPRITPETVKSYQWFQNQLKDDRHVIAGVLDAMVVCVDPTWSSLEAAEPVAAPMGEVAACV